eukprot:TRINITY_DN1447_c0_g1_i1.p1 TRINITY_DN1447_c0_g1~~TRINITY_DN1447_c0_g1_i1.p1  ORF type:complete len:297 (+),score=81.65 TRINITY_DN1447_c0_g1_i1:38-892(+)
MKSEHKINLKKLLGISVCVLFILIFFLMNSSNDTSKPTTNGEKKPMEGQFVKPGHNGIWRYKVYKSFPHDMHAFTQGLQYVDGYFYEGTGLNGASNLRKVNIETGEVLQKVDLERKYFGEGITVLDDKIYQLTWQNHKGFIYDKDSMALLSSWDYPTEGWGLTTDGTYLYMSDGTSSIHVIDPQTLTTITSISAITPEGLRVSKLNELEWVEGEIFANVWMTDYIVRIDPKDGKVLGRIDLKGLLPDNEKWGADVLNGIAYDRDNKRLFVTGKQWKKIYQITLS